MVDERDNNEGLEARNARGVGCMNHACFHSYNTLHNEEVVVGTLKLGKSLRSHAVWTV